MFHLLAIKAKGIKMRFSSIELAKTEQKKLRDSEGRIEWTLSCTASESVNWNYHYSEEQLGNIQEI